MKKILTNICIVLFIILLGLLLYSSIGYFIQGLQSPYLFNETTKTIFTGMYLMSITYFVLFIIANLLFICFIKHTKK